MDVPATCETCGATFEGRTRGGKYCSQKCAGVGFARPKAGESFLDKFPDIADEADGWDPSTVKSGSRALRRWKCASGHEWETAVANRSKGGVVRGCPYCAGIYSVVGETDLATTHPEIAAQADGWDPTTVLPGSSRNKSWRCGEGHTWNASVNSRTDKGTGCPYCSGRFAIAGQTDLATVKPELAAQADGWDPTTVLPNSHSLQRWKCELGHTYEMRVSNRNKGFGCHFCSGRQLLVGFNDLATLFPELAVEADGWDPHATRTSDAKVNRQWRCKDGHMWSASIENRTRAGSGCPVCSGRDVEVGVSDLLTTHPHIAAEAVEWDPTTVKAGSFQRKMWRCQEGHEWRTTVATRTRGKGCPSCARYGFKPEQDAWMYLIENEVSDLMQIGITNNRDERLAKHRRSGFDNVVDVRGPIDGVLARDLERACIRALEKRGATFVKDLDIPRFDGWTEAWSAETMAPASLTEIMNMVYEDD